MTWGRPTMMSMGLMLVMLQPMEAAEFKASVWFSCTIEYTVSLVLFMALSSTVFGTDLLMSLL